MAKTKAELLRQIKKLKRENLALIIECNAAMARAGAAHEALNDIKAEKDDGFVHVGTYILTDRLDG